MCKKSHPARPAAAARAVLHGEPPPDRPRHERRATDAPHASIAPGAGAEGHRHLGRSAAGLAYFGAGSASDQARTLALHVMIAEKIHGDPSLLDIAYRNFDRWQDRSRSVSGEAVRMWRAALRLPWPQIAARLTEQSERGVKLRSTAPFFGILSARERARIFAAFQLPSNKLSGKR